MSDPAVEWHSFFAGLGEGGVYRGHDGTRHYIRDLDEAFSAAWADVQGVVAVGDVVLLTGDIRYRGRDSGVESSTPTGWVLEFRAGRLLRFTAFREPEKAIAALGQSH